jgi:hypothetical protein
MTEDGKAWVQVYPPPHPKNQTYEKNQIGDTPRSTDDLPLGYDNTKLMDWVAALLDACSGHPQGEVLVQFESESGYDDDHSCVITLGYWRDLTPDEKALLDSQAAKKEDLAKRQRQSQYLALKKEFEA